MRLGILLQRVLATTAMFLVLFVASVAIAFADADEAPPAGVNPNTVGMQPLPAAASHRNSGAGRIPSHAARRRLV